MPESVHKWREEPRHLPEDAPNILIVMLDDAGFGQPDTFGGEIHTPTMSRLAKAGISYNAFHTTAMCSPTRAALMTGRNHNRVGFGQIAEFANDWDGYTGVIPKSSATIAEVLGYYGYATAAFGKDHNTPVDQLANGPYDRTPTGRGFDYFYGFIAGETSQWEPALWENINPISPPHVKDHEDYHLTEDMADKAITWMNRHLAVNPDRPFLMWWTPGAVHGPHHVAKTWADKYQDKFSDGWDAYQKRVFERQKAMGWIPADTKLAPRPEGMPAWEDLSEKERAFQARLMEVFAGFLEHTDVQVGKLIDGLEARGIRDNTMVIYILSDNGASAEGMNGSIAELNAQNGIPTTVAEHMEVLEGLGGLDAIGGPKTDNMYHSAWAWAGDSPFRYTKLIAADWGGTRTPMVISWPARIKPDKTPRPQFTHVNDVVPTLYEILGIKPPKVVDGHEQDPIDGVSFAYTFDSATAPEQKTTQYFDIMGSRGIYHKGWMASTFGPRTPWEAEVPDISNWDPMQDQWELFNTRRDFSLMHDLAAEEPEKLEDLKSLFMRVAEENKVLPIGGGLLGLEAANGLLKNGMEVTVVHLLDTLMERQLDKPAASLLQASLEQRGLAFKMEAQTAALLEEAAPATAATVDAVAPCLCCCSSAACCRRCCTCPLSRATALRRWWCSLRAAILRRRRERGRSPSPRHSAPAPGPRSQSITPPRTGPRAQAPTMARPPARSRSRPEKPARRSR